MNTHTLREDQFVEFILTHESPVADKIIETINNCLKVLANNKKTVKYKFKQFQINPEKNSGLQRDLNSWILR